MRLAGSTQGPVDGGGVQADSCGERSASTSARQRPSLETPAVAGALAGAFVTAILHPIDTVKVLLQANKTTRCSIPGVILTSIRQRGPKFLYSGVLPSIAASMPISAVYTFTYEASKSKLERPLSSSNAWLAQCCAGACASMATSFIYTPTECVKAQLQIGRYVSPQQAMISIVRQEGMAGLYKGWGAVLCRNIPQSVIKFLVYEQLQAALTRSALSETNTTSRSLISGAAAATLAACVTTPIDVVKTRIQTQGLTTGVVSTLTALLRDEGIRGLYRGLVPRLGIYMTQGAIFFTAYDVLKTSLRRESTAAAAPLDTADTRGHGRSLPVFARSSEISETAVPHCSQLAPRLDDRDQETYSEPFLMACINIANKKVL